MSASTATERHLRRLRWQLTFLYGVAMALALAVLAYVVIQVDTDLRQTDLEVTLLEKAQQAASAVTFDASGEPDVSRFAAEPDLTQGWPQTYVFATRGLTVEPLAGPTSDWYDIDVRPLAESVLFEQSTWPEWVATLESGSDVVGRGVPLRAPDADTPAFAAVAVVDAGDFFAEQDALIQQVAATAALLVLLASVAGYWLAGRATRSTAEALVRQEQLLSDAAHELRTPVASIRAVSEGGVAGDEPADVALARVVSLSADASTMVDDMLFLARVDADGGAIDPETLRLDLLAEEVASRYQDVTLETVETVVEGDAGLLRRAIDNLVRNAVIHGHGSGVRVTVYPKVVIVTDDGPGLDPSLDGEAMDRMRKGPDSRGHGLGLSIVSWIAEAHDGSVSLTDREGGGAEARLTLA